MNGRLIAFQFMLVPPLGCVAPSCGAPPCRHAVLVVGAAMEWLDDTTSHPSLFVRRDLSDRSVFLGDNLPVMTPIRTPEEGAAGAGNLPPLRSERPRVVHARGGRHCRWGRGLLGNHHPFRYSACFLGASIVPLDLNRASIVRKTNDPPKHKISS